MSKNFFILGFISCILSHFYCQAKNDYFYCLISGDTLVKPGDSISIVLNAASWIDCQPTGNCFLSDFQWFKNGIQLTGETNFIFTATDTGSYRVDFISDCLGLRSKSFRIAYQEELKQANEFETKKKSPFIYSVGSSSYMINMCGRKMKQLLLSENSGRLVLSLLNGASEINLSSFSPGIYYYTIYDEDKNVWRGKIFKE